MNELRDFLDRLVDKIEDDMRRKQGVCEDRGHPGKNQKPRRDWGGRLLPVRKGQANDNAR